MAKGKADFRKNRSGWRNFEIRADIGSFFNQNNSEIVSNFEVPEETGSFFEIPTPR